MVARKTTRRDPVGREGEKHGIREGGEGSATTETICFREQEGLVPRLFRLNFSEGGGKLKVSRRKKGGPGKRIPTIQEEEEYERILPQDHRRGFK